VTQSVGADRFDDARQAGCLFDRLLQAALPSAPLRAGMDSIQ
jgi:hypothetical protein